MNIDINLEDQIRLKFKAYHNECSDRYWFNSGAIHQPRPPFLSRFTKPEKEYLIKMGYEIWEDQDCVHFKPKQKTKEEQQEEILTEYNSCQGVLAGIGVANIGDNLLGPVKRAAEEIKRLRKQRAEHDECMKLLKTHTSNPSDTLYQRTKLVVDETKRLVDEVRMMREYCYKLDALLKEMSMRNLPG